MKEFWAFPDNGKEIAAVEFTLNEQQQMLKGIARDFLEARCPKAHVRDMLADEKGYSPELWQDMAELGWQGLMLPEEYGGTGGDFVDIQVLIEEMGRALLPGPFIPTVVYGGVGILQAGTSEQKNELLPRIAQGELILTLALQESSERFDAEGVAAEAVEKEDHYILSGTKILVPYAHVADYILCVCRSRSSSDAEDGISLFLVDAKGEGISCITRTTFDGRKLCDVKLGEVKVSKANLLGEPHGCWPLVKRLVDHGSVAMCAEAVGGAQMAMEMSISYAKERIQFGRPIGTNQAIKHKCADMFVDVECGRSIMYWAAWAVDEGVPEASLAVPMAKTWCCDAYRRVTADSIQVHGGIGFTWDHDIHLHFKRAKTLEYTFGDCDYQREIVVRELERQLASG
ncbi:MAG: acyl-CoA/acyl-ACP dehydrogenase [Candidatus Latescibacteria bacterium]|nr:acyl-CoA/acyl-ACP dehydrogenase [Candidatus Latescibacterota bacterium]